MSRTHCKFMEAPVFKVTVSVAGLVVVGSVSVLNALDTVFLSSLR
jgi:hypothetical protein